MKLIFDAGSSSISYAVISPDTTPSIHSLPHGHNAASAHEGALAGMISDDSHLSSLAKTVSEIDFYGAGCAGKDACARTRDELTSVFTSASVKVMSDMECAARALCGTDRGIACILGTGANSCLWDGVKITANVSPLGYILGDEGSGAVMGRLFLGMLFKGQLPQTTYDRFTERYRLTSGDIVQRVYRGERPNAFLASFAPFILEEASTTTEVRDLVIGEFRRFLRCNVAAYPEASSLPVSFVGSIAWYFRQFLAEALMAERLRCGRIMRSPLPALAGIEE